ncbi:hypothetical protein FNV43_RR26568 [Rhamnella rubrinervis]|uniref:Uncharacterized protein n=1 Tax=Rhamnella rubrinervis TaxID=2594499 RepID=A0A8K0GJR8_9ROSA|nr:hypothetical protein FNV43_RR26568 [Rhamnella rubrinervis]
MPDKFGREYPYIYEGNPPAKLADADYHFLRISYITRGSPGQFGDACDKFGEVSRRIIQGAGDIAHLGHIRHKWHFKLSLIKFLKGIDQFEA